jgi:hypothetical protein
MQKYQELHGKLMLRQISPTVKMVGTERALILMCPASLSRIGFRISLPRLFDNTNISHSCPASPPLTMYIRLINSLYKTVNVRRQQSALCPEDYCQSIPTKMLRSKSSSSFHVHRHSNHI